MLATRKYVKDLIKGILKKCKDEGKIGGEVYSTEETVCGTWIDGKPLYRRIYTSAMPQVKTNGTAVALAFNHNIEDLDEVIFTRGRIIDNTKTLFHMLNTTASGTIFNRVTASKTQVSIISSGTGWNAYTAEVVVEYTKTTDEATISLNLSEET